MTEVLSKIAWAPALGQRWFQYRSFSPLPIVILLLVLPPEWKATGMIRLGLILMIALFEGIRLWAVGYAGSATRTRDSQVGQLVHAGPFRWVRNPLYVANIGLYCSCCLLFGFGSLIVLALVYFMVQYSFIVCFEESVLDQTFGEAYRDYRSQVPRWLPRGTPSIEASSHQFDLGRAFRSEKSSLIAIVVMGVLYYIKLMT